MIFTTILVFIVIHTTNFWVTNGTLKHCKRVVTSNTFPVFNHLCCSLSRPSFATHVVKKKRGSFFVFNTLKSLVQEGKFRRGHRRAFSLCRHQTQLLQKFPDFQGVLLMSTRKIKTSTFWRIFDEANKRMLCIPLQRRHKKCVMIIALPKTNNKL